MKTLMEISGTQQPRRSTKTQRELDFLVIFCLAQQYGNDQIRTMDSIYCNHVEESSAKEDKSLKCHGEENSSATNTEHLEGEIFNRHKVEFDDGMLYDEYKAYMNNLREESEVIEKDNNFINDNIDSTASTSTSGQYLISFDALSPSIQQQMTANRKVNDDIPNEIFLPSPIFVASKYDDIDAFRAGFYTSYFTNKSRIDLSHDENFNRSSGSYTSDDVDLLSSSKLYNGWVKNSRRANRYSRSTFTRMLINTRKAHISNREEKSQKSNEDIIGLWD